MSARPYKQPLQLVWAAPRFNAGRRFYVDSTYGSNSYSGTDPNYPFYSITYAVSKCVDDHDDLIIVRPGYDNTLTDAVTGGDDTPIAIDKNGVTLLFSGKNNVIQAIASADSIFQIDATQVTIGVMPNSRVYVKAAEAGTASTVVEIKAGATDAEVYGIRTQSLDNYDEPITIAATAHRAYIHDCWLIGNTTDTDEGVVLGGTVDGVRIENNFIYDCGASGGQIYSNAAHTNCIIKNNYLDARTASKKGINFNAGSATGVIVENWIYVDTDNVGCINQNCAEFRQHITDLVTANSFPSPAVGAITT